MQRRQLLGAVTAGATSSLGDDKAKLDVTDTVMANGRCVL
jgi:hypothetical protein